MLAHDPSPRRRTFHVDGNAISDVLLRHWQALKLHRHPDLPDLSEGWVAGLKDLILSGGTEHDLAEALSGYGQKIGAKAPDLYACHLAARMLLAL